MADMEKLRKNLEANGFQTSCFDTPQEAAAYLNGQLDGETIGFGGSMTVKELGLFDTLTAHNTCLWHWTPDAPASSAEAAAAPVYICSVNGVAETGELINIDGACNRVSATLFGKKKVYFIVGENKIAPDYDAALWRARNIAAPLNARRLNKKTPCAQGELKCHDCGSPERICRGLVVLWKKPTGVEQAEVVLVRQALGY